jgi:hypothetical protein
VCGEHLDGARSRWKAFGSRHIYDNPWVWLGKVDVEAAGDGRFWHHVARLNAHLACVAGRPLPGHRHALRSGSARQGLQQREAAASG